MTQNIVSHVYRKERFIGVLKTNAVQSNGWNHVVTLVAYSVEIG